MNVYGILWLLARFSDRTERLNHSPASNMPMIDDSMIGESHMNYSRIYSEFIADRRAKPVPFGYVENHHALPRSLGGDDSKSNMISLSAGDHYFAHLLLAKIHGKGMWNALWLMAQTGSTASGRGVLSKRHTYEAVKKRMAEAMTGKNNPFYGKKHSAETRKRISEISFAMSDETKAKMSKAAKCKVVSNKTRQKMSESFSGSGNSFYGKAHTQETKDKIAKANKGYVPTEETLKKLSKASAGLNNPRCRSVMCVETGVIYGMTKDAAKSIGVNLSNIVSCCGGYQKTSGGYHWRYVDA